MLDVPFFQSMAPEGPSGKIQKASSFSAQLTGGAQRSGYGIVRVHDGRREALVKADCMVLILVHVQISIC
jgi:hypothetical protein